MERSKIEMTRLVAMAALLVLSTACAQRTEDGPSASDPDDLLTLQAVTADPSAYDGRPVRLESGYYAAREASVLTPGFAESYPPQPLEPVVWVGAAPPSGCLEEAAGVAWAERVIAEGIFRYDAGGFGHLGRYDMALENATLTCS
jgi:hypothetical protein